MTKGAYQVNDDENPNKSQPKDTSYKSCICALLFVLVICIIILIATSIWSPRRSTKDTTINGELSALEQERNTKNTTAKIIMQTEGTTTTGRNQYTSATNATTTQYLTESSSVTIPIKNENSLKPSDYSTTSETPTENVEKPTTVKNKNASTEAYADTESPASVSSNYQYSANNTTTSETPTKNIQETTTKKTKSTSTADHSTAANYSTESSVPVSLKYQHTTSHPDDNPSSETPTKNIKETTTKETKSTSTADDSTAANYSTESSVPVSSKYQHSTLHPDPDTASEIPTKSVEETTTKETKSTSTADYSTAANYSTESSVPVSSKYQHTTSHPDDISVSKTPTKSVEETTTKETKSTSTADHSTAANYGTESSVPVSSKYQHTSAHPDDNPLSETPTKSVEETTTKETKSTSTADHSTAANYGTESSVPVSSKYQHTSAHPDDNPSSETPTRNIKETTTKETKSTSTADHSTAANYGNESSVPVSSKYQHTTAHPDDNPSSETPTKSVEETTTKETKSSSTAANYGTESSVPVSSKYQHTTAHPGDNPSSETPTKSVEETTTKNTKSTSTSDHSTAANYNTESSVPVSSKYQQSTLQPETLTKNVEETTTRVNGNSSTENIGSSFLSFFHLGTTTATTVSDEFTTRRAQSVPTNQPTTNNWSIDASSPSSTTTEDKESSENVEFTIPNDSSGSSYFSYKEPDPSTTTQTPVRQALNQQIVNTPDVCSTAECKTVASRTLSFMNHSEDPCEDFYEFSCGETRDHNNNRDTWDRLLKEINLINDSALPHFIALKSFYTSCVEHENIFNHTERILQVTELVKEVGWIIDSKTNPLSVDLTSLFAKLILRQSLPIFDVEVDLDSQTKTFILKLLPRQMHSMFAESGRWSGLSESQIRCLMAERDALKSPKLDLNKIHLSYLNCQKDYGVYLNSVESVVENLGLYSNTMDWFTKSQLIKELRTSIEWKFLAFLEELPAPNIVREKVLFKNQDQYYAVMRVRDLQDKYPLVNWKTMFEMIAGNTISYDTQIETYFPEYIEKIFKELQNDQTSSTIEINNALISMYAHSLYQNLVIPQSRHHREDYCLKLSTKLFQDVSNNLYFKTWKNTDFVNYQKTSLEIFSQLKNKFKTEVETQDKWLDESSKRSLLKKLDDVKLIVTKQEDRYNYGGYLQATYQINFIENNWPSNAVKMVTKYRKMLYSIQGSAISTEKLWSFFINSYDSTPTSIYGLGWTVAPLGTMKKFISNVPNYITMIKIGLPLAREIGHHFDHEGIVNGMNLFGMSRDYYNYMNYLTNNNTLNTTISVGNQKISFDVESQLSANERIADNTALRLLSEIYNEKDNPGLPWISTSYPKQKLFFILVAQEYCSRVSMPEFMQKLFESEILPSTLRVKNIVTNSEEFSRTFECSRTPKEIEGVSFKIQFPYLENLNITIFYSLLK